MQHQFYKIITKSNTHVGSGQNSYGIVDNVVQKDYINNHPCINSTSLKGALREYFENQLSLSEVDIYNIFGSKPTENDNTKLQPGSHYFHQAYLLSYPMRSNMAQYFDVTCPTILQHLYNELERNQNATFDALKNELKNLLDKAEIKDIEKTKPISDTTPDAIIEKHTIQTKKVADIFSTEIKKIFGNNLVVMHNDEFNSIVKKLPIITRNQLENGQSANLFYEEVVPRETIFGFFISAKNIDTHFSEIKNVQIGANATVGYGFCSLNKVI